MFMTSKSAIVAITLLGCLSVPSHASVDGIGWRSLDSAQIAPELVGVWQSEATGHLIAFTDTGYAVFHKVGELCLADTGQLPALQLFQVLPGQTRAELFFYDYRLHPDLLQNPLSVVRVDALPPHCMTADATAEHTLAETFDAVWKLFDRHYAFFEERTVDWSQARQVYQPRAEQAESADALFDILVEMLRPLNDGHVNLSWGERSFNAGRPRLRQQLTEAWRDADTELSEGAFVGQWSRQVRQSIGRVLDEGSHRIGADGAVEWGLINQRVGYLRVNRFARFDAHAPNRAAELETLRQTLVEASLDLSSAERLIVDVAHNGGGHDAAAMTVVEYFLDQPREVLIYAVPGTEARHVRLAPSGQGETRDITLLTSEVTASAAEAFVLMMRALPHVTHAGERTRGGISSLLPKPLPLGFQVTVSYQPVLDAEGRLFEGSGIPPEQTLILFPEGELFDGYAAGLEQLAQ